MEPGGELMGIAALRHCGSTYYERVMKLDFSRLSSTYEHIADPRLLGRSYCRWFDVVCKPKTRRSSGDRDKTGCVMLAGTASNIVDLFTSNEPKRPTLVVSVDS